jgi:hypothetical protein
LKLALSTDLTGVTLAATLGAARAVFFLAARLFGEAALTLAETTFFLTTTLLCAFLDLAMVIFRRSEFQ